VLAKKKMKQRGRKRDGVTSSSESDPILNSNEGVGCDTNGSPNISIAAFQGVGLEIVLPMQTEDVMDGQMTLCNRVIAGDARRGTDSGVAGLLGNNSCGSVSSHASSKTRDKEYSDAHHIIDIQEELGMNFVGSKDEMVRMVVELESRDRKEKLDWEQEQSYQ
jgi:hypothetical protein